MIAYKVLDSAQRSAIASGEASIFYDKNQWTLPRFNGRLFVFKHFKDALKFRGMDQHVWRCEVPSLKKIKIIAPYFSVAAIARFWDKEDQERKNMPKHVAPTGSYTATKVKLLQRYDN